MIKSAVATLTIAAIATHLGLSILETDIVRASAASLYVEDLSTPFSIFERVSTALDEVLAR